MRVSQRELPIPYIALTPLIAAPVWAAAGTYKPWQGSFLWLCLWAWGWFLLGGNSRTLGTRTQRLKKLLCDPLIWLSLLFIAYLTLQFHNTGRIRVFDFDENRWVFSLPPYPSLPWSFNGYEAFEMIRWFAPVLTVFAILRHSWQALSPVVLLRIVCVNGLLNAALAFTHLMMGWEKMYGIQQFGRDVYGSFGYPNNGATYFIILFSIGLGLLLKELLCESAERSRLWLSFAAVCTVVFFLAASLSGSRTGILGVWLSLFCTLFSLLWIGWPRLHPVQRILTTLGGLGCLGIGIAAYLTFVPPDVLTELRDATVNLNTDKELTARWFQIRAAVDMWRDHPWYGVGGWGYRYLLAEYLPVSEWGILLKKGKANVHNDLVQFWVEFGLVGFGLLTSVFLPALLRCIRHLFLRPLDDRSVWADPLRIASLWGVGLVAAHSLIDLPLRSPAVYIHAILLFQLLSPHPRLPSIWNPVVRWKPGTSDL